MYKYNKFDRYWTEGRLLNTMQTIRWTDEQRQEADYEERCRAFRNFTWIDNGKSRIFIKRFDTPDTCTKAVMNHNLIINFVDRLCKALNIAHKYKKEK